MDHFAFCIRDPRGGIQRAVERLLKGNSLAVTLAAPFEIHLKVDGKSVPIVIGGVSSDSVKTSWGGLSMQKLDAFLQKYRQDPDACKPDEEVRAALHHFLFAGSSLDATAPTDSGTPLLIEADEHSTRLLTNVPWELTNHVPHLQVSPQANVTLATATLAFAPLARALDVSSVEAKLREHERMHVLYCISQPNPESPIEASDFCRFIDEKLQARSGMLDFTPVAGPQFKPSFQQLLAAIDKQPPHVLVVVCHGTTDDGTPKLQFEDWQPVSELAAKLAEHGKTLLTLLIACDLTFLDDGPSAHSGAVVLLEHGIPFVVAMQGRVQAALATTFLETILDQFFQTGNVFAAVANGRRSMAPTAIAAESYLDWSFPSLFVCNDAEKKGSAFFRLIERYVPTLEAMLRAIPRDAYLNVERAEFEAWLREHLKARSTGVIGVWGLLGTGTSSLVRHVCRTEIMEAIRMRDTKVRPILFVDLERHAGNVNSVYGLIEVLRVQAEEAQPSAGSTSPINWPQYRGGDSEFVTPDVWKQLIELLDNNRMVLVIDHTHLLAARVRSEFLWRSKNLLYSLVVVIDSTKPQDVERLLPVEPFSLDETRAYVSQFVPAHESDADKWYNITGGNLRLLDALRRAPSLEVGDARLRASDVEQYTRLITAGLSESDLEILATLVHLPGGVDSVAAWEFVAPWPQVLGLASRGFLMQEHRFEMSTPWVRLPGVLAQGLTETYPNVVQIAAGNLVERFCEAIEPAPDASRYELVVRIAERRGGVTFLHQIHAVLLDQDDFLSAEALAAHLHQWLFARSRWGSAFALWERLLEQLPREEIDPFYLMSAARCAQALGMAERAREYLASVADFDLDRLEIADSMMVEAVILKDEGHTDESLAEFHRLSDEVLRVLDILEAEIRAGNTDDWELSEIVERRALTLYNRSLIYAHWEGRIADAVSGLFESAELFHSVDVPRMAAMADCEWVDVNLVSAGPGSDWELMFRRLVMADDVFHDDGAWGDAAFCNYQLARYYRRLPAANDSDRESNISKAVEAYKTAAQHAAKAGDARR